VQKGDTLWRIAEKELGRGARYPEIKKLNELTSDTIYPGQVLKLPE
jgi:N-acetylmuramoyl-L-alanine amidase